MKPKQKPLADLTKKEIAKVIKDNSPSPVTAAMRKQADKKLQEMGIVSIPSDMATPLHEVHTLIGKGKLFSEEQLKDACKQALWDYVQGTNDTISSISCSLRHSKQLNINRWFKNYMTTLKRKS